MMSRLLLIILFLLTGAGVTAGQVLAVEQSEARGTSAQPVTQELRLLPVTLGQGEGQSPAPQVAGNSVSTQPVPAGTPVTKGDTGVAGQIGNAVLIVVMGALVIILVAALIGGLMGHWVIYYDKADVMGSALPGICLIVSGFALVFSLAAFDKSGFGEKAVAILLLIGCLAITLWLAVKAIRLSIIDNDSSAVGIMVGLLKIAVSWYAMLTTLEALQKVFGKSTKRTGVFQAMAQLAVMTFLAKFLVNGHEVYKKRGWPLR
jgi:hypothetical protein